MAVMATPSLRFPLPAGGTERARGSVPLAKQGQPSLHAVFLVKRGEPHGGGELMTSERAIDMTPAYENPLLKVPPASRGNRTGARLGSPREAGGTLRRGVDNKPRSKDRMPRLTIATVPSTIETVPSPSETVPSSIETVPSSMETVPTTIETLQSAIATIQSGNATPQPSKSHTLGIVLDYPAGDLAAQLSQLKAQGVQRWSSASKRCPVARRGSRCWRRRSVGLGLAAVAGELAPHGWLDYRARTLSDGGHADGFTR